MSADELKESKPGIEDQCQQINSLECYPGFVCLQSNCQYATRHFRKMREHMPSVHQVKAAAHKKSALWKGCKLQTYFTSKGLIDYFVVTDNGKSEQGLSAAAEEGLPLAEREKTYFEQIKDDYKKV